MVFVNTSILQKVVYTYTFVFFCLLLGVFIFSVPGLVKAQTSPSEIRINAGGSTQTSGGTSWSRCNSLTACNGYVDAGFTYNKSGVVISDVPSNMTQAIFQTEWAGGQSTNIPVGQTAFQFQIPVANQQYQVRLYFSENSKTGVGQRVFDVNLEGTPILQNFDIYAQAGGMYKAIYRDFYTSVSDGNITLDFIRGVENAKVSAIEITPVTFATNTPTPTFTSSPTPTATFTPTDTLTPTETPTPVISDTPTATPTETVEPTPTETPAITMTPTIIPTATPTVGPQPNSITWVSKANAPVGRAETQGVVINNKLYVFGGYNGNLIAMTRSDVYDPATNTWTRIADMPEALTHVPVVTDGTKAYLIGGFVGDHPGPSTRHVWIYDTVSDTWIAGPDLPAERASGGAALVGRQIHFFGGTVRIAGTTIYDDKNDHYMLDLDDLLSSWQTKAPLPSTRNHMAGIALYGKLYAIGGQLEQREESLNQSLVEMYDPTTDSWTQVADMPTQRGHITSSIDTLAGRIYVVGGTNNGGTGGLPSADVAAYEPVTNTWTILTDLPSARKAPVVGFINGKVYVHSGNAGAKQGASRTLWEGTVNFQP